MAEETDDRERTIPIYGPKFEWWTIAVRRQLKTNASIGKGPADQAQLSARLGERPDRVSRAITRKVPAYDLLIAISDELAIAYPVILPEDENEALALAKARRLYRRDTKIGEIAAGVPKRRVDDQSEPVSLENAGPKRAERRNTKERRAARR